MTPSPLSIENLWSENIIERRAKRLQSALLFICSFFGARLADINEHLQFATAQISQSSTFAQTNGQGMWTSHLILNLLTRGMAGHVGRSSQL